MYTFRARPQCCCAAREEIRSQARKIDAVASSLHDDGYDQTAAGAQTIAADLLSSFLLPEVERQTRRQQIKEDQRKFIRVAHMVSTRCWGDAHVGGLCSFAPSVFSLTSHSPAAPPRPHPFIPSSHPFDALLQSVDPRPVDACRFCKVCVMLPPRSRVPLGGVGIGCVPVRPMAGSEWK